MSNKEIMEKLRARRRAMKESLNETANTSMKSSNSTWGAALEDPMEEDKHLTGGEESSVEVIDEIKESETLMNDLSKRRKQRKKELSKTLKGQEGNVHEQIRSAKVKSRKKIEEIQQQDEDAEAEEALEEVTPLGDIEQDGEDEVDAGPVSSSRSTGRKRGLLSLGDTALSASGSFDDRSPRKTPRSLSESMREKLKSRVQSAKAKGETEVKDEIRPGRRLRRERSMTTRFDDPLVLNKEDYEAEQTLERSLKMRNKWKKASDAVTGQPFMPNAEEQFDFFTRNWDPVPEEKAAEDAEEDADQTPAAAADEEEKDEEEPEAADEDVEAGTSAQEDQKKKKKGKKKDEEKRLLLEDYIEDEAEAWKYYQMGKASYVPFQERLKKEDELYFQPSILEAPASEKIFDQDQPRYLEDEGFYVGTPPPVPGRNIHKLENRLLKQADKGRQWFGEDGRLITLPDPLKEIPSRPQVPEEPDPYLKTEFEKAIMREFDTRYIDGSLDSYGQYQLDVDINTVTFSHHHLFSREHVLAARITDQYSQYVRTQEINAIHFLTEKIRALRSAILHLQENIQNLKGQGKNNHEFSKNQENRLQDYRYEIRQARKQRDSEMSGERSLLRNIIFTWKEIKSLRDFQKCTNTSVRLQIKKEKTKKSEDELAWQQDMAEELEDQRGEYEDNYHQQMALYTTLLDEWKSQRKNKREATKRKKRKGRKGNAEEEGDEEDLIQQDDEVLNEDDLPKPNKPVPFNEEEVRQRLEEKFREIRRMPGEPLLYPELTSTATITPKNQCPRGEQNRRDDVDKTKIFVKVIYNNKEVSRTLSKPIGQDFKVSFAFIYNIQIVQWPESIKLQLFESSGLSSTMLSELYMSIPEATVTAENVQMVEADFSSDQRFRYSHEAVGSGVLFSFESDNSNMISLLTTGSLSTSVAWGVDEAGHALVPPTGNQMNKFYNAMKGMDALAAIGASGLTDLDKLTKWIAESRLDPNDPSNADLVCLLRPGDGKGSEMRVPEHFRLEQLQEEFNFATDSDFETSRRFKMIQYREQEVPEFRNYKLIPSNDKECPQDSLQEYEKKKREAERIRLMDDGESHRLAVAKFMQRVREQVIERFRIASHQKNLTDVVYEEMVPNIGVLIPNLLKMTEPRRPLKPIRKERKKVTAQNLQSMDVKILVNVVRAFDIPIRSESVGSATGPTPRPGQAGVSSPRPAVRNIAGEVLVRPFIEATFQRHQQATSVADGPNPSWNEELCIPFKAPNNDYSASNLQTVNDVVYLNLFDEYVVDVLQDERERQTNVQYRKEKRYMGSIKIPFSTIYFNSRIDGTFRVNKPPVLLGYTSDAANNKVESGGATYDMGIGDRESTYLSTFITIEPQLTPAEPMKEKMRSYIVRHMFESNEEEKLLEYAEKYQTELEKRWDKREYKVTVVDINGKSVFITRYFKALKPPQELLDQHTDGAATSELVARYVSLIPFVSDSVVFPGMCDIWSTCDQFLQMLQGDEEEHAVMLTNFFLHMGKKTWLLLGSAIPEGPTAYVLTQENTDYWVWNASTGDHWSYQDNYCPVQSVGCLVNDQNIWANIQTNDQPCRISFDLNNVKNWKPFFHKNYPNPGLSSVQPESLIYFKTEAQYVLDLQDKVERVLKEKVMEWRPRHITRWNRFCIQAFRTLLVKLEETRGKGVHDEHMKELDKILGSYKLCGFPIHMAYTEMEPIIEAVYATGVHVQETSDVEFALAVHIHPYPNSVLSLWVYIASLVRKR